MRKFWLENNERKIWDLTPIDPYVLRSNVFAFPSGLGIKIKVDSYEIENTYFIENVEISTQTISGQLYFSNYEHFLSFTSFISNINTHNPLRLYYSTEGKSYNNKLDPQWYKLVLISELKKSEISIKTSFLECDISFLCLSHWKKDKEITLELTRYSDAHVYPYVYEYYYGGNNNLAVDINNEGSVATSCRLRVNAETDTPIIRLLQNNEITDQAKYNLVVRKGSYLIIDSAVNKQEATLYTELSDGTVTKENVYYSGEKDYSYSNFLLIPVGESRLLFSATNANFGNVTVSYSVQKELV